VGDSPETNGGETLADAARDEREVAAQRLRDELNRDPTDAEIDEWLRRHTEGY
jgi:DNA-directed RNA polymerase specialized sigma subunit